MTTIAERAAATIQRPIIQNMANTEMPISEQFRLVAKRYVDADAAASILEETKTAVLSERMLALGEMPVSKAEMQVKGSPDWRDHIVKIVEARKASNLLKAQMEYLRMRERELDRAEWAQRSERKQMRTTT